MGNIPPVLTIQELKDGLEASGHSTYITHHGGLGVSPPSEEFIAISTGVEHTLPVKLHFFGCPPEPTAIFSWASCPEHVASPWLSWLSRFPPTYPNDTLAVIGTWSFARVASWGATHLWVDGGTYFKQSDRDKDYEEIESRMGQAITFLPFRSHHGDGSSTSTTLVEPSRDDLAEIIAAYVLLANLDFVDVYLARADLREVLAIDHHDLVVVSLPERSARSELLRQLRAAPHLFVPAIFRERPRGEDEDQDEEDIS